MPIFRPVPGSTPPLNPGNPAPPRRVHGADGSTLTLGPGDAEPVVLAFLDRWSLGKGEYDSMEAVRAELRALDAVLVAVTRDALWCFRPCDEAESFVMRSELDAAEIETLRTSYGLDGGGEALGLFVIDGNDTIRFAHVAAAEVLRRSGDVLLASLAAAGRALVVPRPRSGLVSRSELAAACLVVGFAVILLDASEPAPSSLPPGPISGIFASGQTWAREVDITLDVNGGAHSLRMHPGLSLLDVLRHHLGMTGTKKGCDHGQCGACTVLVDGRRANACTMLAIAVQGRKITTIEGLARGAELHAARSTPVVDARSRS